MGDNGRYIWAMEGDRRSDTILPWIYHSYELIMNESTHRMENENTRNELIELRLSRVTFILFKLIVFKCSHRCNLTSSILVEKPIGVFSINIPHMHIPMKVMHRLWDQITPYVRFNEYTSALADFAFKYSSTPTQMAHFYFIINISRKFQLKLNPARIDCGIMNK